MEAVQIQGLLPVILNKLEGIVDIVRCSSVSKTWQAVSSQVCPTALFVPIPTVPTLDESGQHIEDVELDRAGAANMLIWLQSKHRQGHFCNLESLSIEQEQFSELSLEEGDNDDMLSLFCQSMLVLAGLWPLQHCYIEGPFNWTVATRLLPTTLRDLRLCPRVLPAEVSLAKLSRLPNLERVDIDAMACARPTHSPCFVLDDGCSFPHLRSLILSGCQVVHSVQNLPVCLPTIKNVAVWVEVNHAGPLLTLPGLECLGLFLVDKTDSIDLLSIADQMLVTVRHCSALRHLTLLGPKLPAISVDIDNPNYTYSYFSPSGKYEFQQAGMVGGGPKGFYTPPTFFTQTTKFWSVISEPQ